MNARFEMLIEGLADPRLAERVAADRRPVGAPRAAVLLLLSDSEAPDLLFTERSARMRTHAGQISFPGGGFEPQDADAAAAALRETWEEVGLPPAQVAVIGQLPATRLLAAVLAHQSVQPAFDTTRELEIGRVDGQHQRRVHHPGIEPVRQDQLDAQRRAAGVGKLLPFVDPGEAMQAPPGRFADGGGHRGRLQPIQGRFEALVIAQ